MVDENMLIKQAIDTGDVYIGAREAEKAIKKNTAKLIVVATNCPKLSWMKNISIKIHKYKGNSVDLGVACGKPFSVSVIAILDPGDSGIMSL